MSHSEEGNDCCSNSRISVQFTLDVTVHPISPACDYTEFEVQSCWYSKKELQQIKDEVDITLEKIERCEVLDEDVFCERGVSQLTKENISQFRKLQYDAFDAVFSEQEHQWESGVIDGELIASLYNCVTFKSQLAAYLVGVSDEQAARSECYSTLTARFQAAAATKKSSRGQEKAPHDSSKDIERSSGPPKLTKKKWSFRKKKSSSSPPKKFSLPAIASRLRGNKLSRSFRRV